jgi:hypothetical protein
MDLVSIIILCGFVALFAYEFGKNKPKRDRAKRQEEEYNAAIRENRKPRIVP